MNRSSPIDRPRAGDKAPQALAALLLFVALALPAPAVTLLFEEDFDQLPLTTAPTYGVPGVWTNDPPAGWDTQHNVPPGGVPEWAGWAFADHDFWVSVGQATGQGGRGLFGRGQGTIAVADPGLWNSTPNDPANRTGFYNTLLSTPPIPLDGVDPQLDDTLRLAFDSSWRRGECCNDGLEFDPGGDNQSAFINVRIDGGDPIEVLRWESAPFYEEVDTGVFRPSNDPFDPSGAPNQPNEFFRPSELDERFYLELSEFLPPGGPAFALAGVAAASSGGGSIQIEFGMEGAGDDGWWGIDNVQLLSMSTIPGDMNINSMLDAGDIDAFALGMRSEEGYRDAYFGAYPVDRGSLDSAFNFDDIPWFVSVMEGAGQASAAHSLARALGPVPEPSAALLAVAALLLAPARRRP